MYVQVPAWAFGPHVSEDENSINNMQREKIAIHVHVPVCQIPSEDLFEMAWLNMLISV